VLAIGMLLAGCSALDVPDVFKSHASKAAVATTAPSAGWVKPPPVI
jgi:hypothetical protein